MADDLATAINRVRAERDQAQRQVAIAAAALLRIAESAQATARDARAALEAMEKTE